MGGTCCKATFDPKRVHIKKINEIFLNYLKNQGLNPKTDLGSDQITQNMIEGIERHAKGSCKDLISLMQINKKFIRKICNVLSKRIAEPIYTAELRLLGLVLIRELMLTPIKKRDPKQRRNINSHHQRRHGSGSSHQLQDNSEFIFCILNEKLIFATIKDCTAKVLQGCVNGAEKDKNNTPYFIHESLQIFNILLTTLQQSLLLENEDDYLDFLTPFLSFNEKNVSQVQEVINQSHLGQTIYIEIYKGFFKIIQQMKENNFRQKFQQLFKTTWILIMKAQQTFQSLRTLESQNDSALNLEEIHLQDIQHQKEEQVLIQQQKLAISPKQQNQIERPSVFSVASTNPNQNPYQLYQIGFDILRYLSQRISQDVQNEEQIQQFLTPIFEYFNNQDRWQSQRFARFTLLTIIYNCKEISQVDRQSFSISHLVQENGQMMELNNEKLIDYQMLDFICDLSLKYLSQDLRIENSNNNSGLEDRRISGNNQEIGKVLFTKKNLLEVFSDLLQLLSYDNNIRQFNAIKYFEPLVMIVNYMSKNQVEIQLQFEVEKQLRIFAETYLSKISETDQLVCVLDFLLISIQDEVLNQNNNEIVPVINKNRVSSLIRLIEAVIYFIMNHLDCQQDSSSNLQSDSQGGVKIGQYKKKSGIVKCRKIKDSHLILLMNLANRCLDDGFIEETNSALLLSSQMIQINNEIIFNGESRTRAISSDFVIRYLNQINDLFKTDMESVLDTKCTFAQNIFDIWRLIIVPFDQNFEVQSNFLGFLVHLQNQIVKSKLPQKQEARYRVLNFFMSSLASLVFEMPSFINALANLKELKSIDLLFWSKLPALQKQELLLSITQKLDKLMSEDLHQDAFIKQALLLRFEDMDPSMVEIFDSYLLAKTQQANQLKQKVELFRHTESRQNVNLNELSQKKQNSFDMNNKFMMQSMSITDLNDSILSSHRSNIFEETQQNNIGQNMFSINKINRNNHPQLLSKNLEKQDSLCSEFLENGSDSKNATQNYRATVGYDEYQIDQNFN